MKISSKRKHVKSDNANVTENVSKTETQNSAITDAIYNLLPTIPAKLKSIHSELKESEKALLEIDQQINAIREKLRPISAHQRGRGVKSDISPVDRKFLMASKKRLKEQRFLENQQWLNKMKDWSTIVWGDIQRTESSIMSAKANSLHYITHNKLLIVNRTKSLLDSVRNTPDKLKELKSIISNKESEKRYTGVKQWLSEHDKNGFLTIAYSAHEKLREEFESLFVNLINKWNPKDRTFQFKNAHVEFNLSQNTKRGTR